MKRTSQMSLRLNQDEEDILRKATQKSKASLRYTLLMLCRLYIAGDLIMVSQEGGEDVSPKPQGG